MRGQTGIEFVISIALFLIVLTYSVSTIIGIIPAFWEQSNSHRRNSLAFQISQHLLFSDNFTDNPYVLNKNKLEKLDKDNDKKLRNMVGIGNTTVFGFRITSTEGTEKFSRYMNRIGGSTERMITDRAAVLKGQIVRVRVFVG